ncbi:S24 family peptidase [Nonomuraea salmonea]|uniref:S24 family peptidase n=1 Tax=Nonomuraea salmonea TaxID=46181 RepID=UPI002FE96BF9
MWYVLGAVAVLAVLAVVARRALVVVRVSGVSMAPTFRPGDRVLVRRTAAVRRGQVVVFESTRPTGWGHGAAGAAVGDQAGDRGAGRSGAR